MKRLVYALDDAKVTQDDYDSVVSRAVNGFLTHAAEEETDQLPKLKADLSAEENDVRVPFPARFSVELMLDVGAETGPQLFESAQNGPYAPSSNGATDRWARSKGSGCAGHVP